MSATQVRHECYTNDTSATRLENLDFDNNTGKNIFSQPYIYYIASERLQGEEQFHTNNYFLEMSRFHAKMRLKSAPQKLNFLMAKAISKSCTLDCTLCKNVQGHLQLQSSVQFFNGKSYIKKLYTRLSLQMSLHVLAKLRTVMQPHF